MAGRVNSLDGLVAADGHVHRRLLQGAGGELLGGQGVSITHKVVVATQDLCVFQLDASLALGWDRIHAGLEGAAPDVLQQSGIAPPAHGVLVDAAGFLLRE